MDDHHTSTIGIPSTHEGHTISGMVVILKELVRKSCLFWYAWYKNWNHTYYSM